MTDIYHLFTMFRSALVFSLQVYFFLHKFIHSHVLVSALKKAVMYFVFSLNVVVFMIGV